MAHNAPAQNKESTDGGPRSVAVGSSTQGIVAAEVHARGPISFETKNSTSQFHQAVVTQAGGKTHIKGPVNFFNNGPGNPLKSRILNWLQSLFRLNSWKRSWERYTHYLSIHKQSNGIGAGRLAGDEFKSWFDGKQRTLWCLGEAGVGKTILSAILVDHLRQRIDGERLTVNGDQCCAFAFFDYQEPEAHMVEDFLVSLLVQLVNSRSSTSRGIEETVDNYETWATPPPRVCLESLIRSEIASCTRVYFVIDAVDQVATAAVRTAIFSILRGFRADNVFTFLTSRPSHEIRKHVSPSVELNLVPNEQDIKAYIEMRAGMIENKDQLGEQGHIKSSMSVEQIVSLVGKAKIPTFLNVDLQIAAYASRSKETRALDDSREPAILYNDIYTRELQLIRCRSESERIRTACVLAFACYSARPLAAGELAEAVTVAEKIPGKENGKIVAITPADLHSLCPVLISIDKQTHRVSPVHGTAWAFLTSDEAAKSLIGDPHHLMATVSINHLLRLGADSTILPSSSTCPQPQSCSNFANYAADFWGFHARNSEKDERALATQLLDDRDALARAITAMSYEARSSLPGVTGTQHAMHLAAYFGSKTLTRRLLDREDTAYVAVRTSSGHTPLHIAAMLGRAGIIKVLLNEGRADVAAQDERERTSLHYAVMNGHDYCIQILVQAGAEAPGSLDLRDAKGCTPLAWTAVLGMHKTAKKLLRDGTKARPNLDAEDKDGFSILQLATLHGHLRLVRLLILHGAQVNRPTSTGWLILHEACKQDNRSELLRTLLSPDIRRNVNIDQQDEGGNTPLYWAVFYRLGFAVGSLLQSGASIDGVDKQERTVLHLAVQDWKDCKDRTIFWLLAQHALAKNINQADKNGSTALHLAAERGLVSPTMLLLEKGAVLRTGDGKGLTPLHLAAKGGHLHVVMLLLEKKAGPDARDKGGRTPLHYAAEGGFEAVVRLLLDQGARGQIGDDQGRTPLHYAVVQDTFDSDPNQADIYFSIARLFAHGPADTNRLDQDGRTPLHAAVQNRWPAHAAKLVLMLLGHGANASQADTNGLTPLHLAVAKCSGVEGEEISHTCALVKYLLDEGADPYAQEKTHKKTPLQSAAEHGKVALLDLMKQHVRQGKTASGAEGRGQTTRWEIEVEEAD